MVFYTVGTGSIESYSRKICLDKFHLAVIPEIGTILEAPNEDPNLIGWIRLNAIRHVLPFWTMDDSKPESTTEEVLCHRCGNVVMPREDEPFVVKHGMTTCPDCLLFIEKNGTTSNTP